MLPKALHDGAERAGICQVPSRGRPPFTGVSKGEQIWPLSRSGEACGELVAEDPCERARSGRGIVNPAVRGKGRHVDSRAGAGPEASTGRACAAIDSAPWPGLEALAGWAALPGARAAAVPAVPPWR